MKDMLRGVAVLAMLGSAGAVSAAKAERPVPIGAERTMGTHLVPPREDVVLRGLQEDGQLSLNPSAEQMQGALQKHRARFSKFSESWVNPGVAARARAREIGVVGGPQAAALLTGAPRRVSVRVLALTVDFDGAAEDVTYEALGDWDSDPATADTCALTSTSFAGPRRGLMVAPTPPNPSDPTQPYDNNTVWYTPTQTASPSFYARLIFGTTGVARIRTDLRDPRDRRPGINASGVTVQDYYNRVAGPGNVVLSGAVRGWVTVDHPEAYYGADTCSGGHHGGARDGSGNQVFAANLIEEAVAKFNAANPTFNWRAFDANRDGIVDTFWVIHAGAGQEGGGGAEGEFSLWSHSSDTRNYGYARGVKVFEGNPAITTDDIYIGPYTVQPENATVGVMSEEFGHNVFGLPDLYVSDTQGSIAGWSIMEAGAWGGYLGGAQPVSMPLWFKMIADCGGQPCNWDKPMWVRNYDDPTEELTVGQLESTPGGARKGVRVNLPRVFEPVANPVGTGKAAYTDTGINQNDIMLDLPVAIPAAAPGLLTIPSQWDIEGDWDYGYVEVLPEGSNTWVMLDDVDAYFTNTNPNGNNLGDGLTGTGAGTLQFNLAAYAGQTITLRLRYVTDAYTTGDGWYVDDLALDGTPIADFDATAPLGAWTNSGWTTVPLTRSNAQYYLVEWRNKTRYDSMVQTNYITTYSDANTWMVERVPYNIPGALVYFRDTRYTNTYAQRPNYYDSPSFGPKYQLLAVDVNPKPLAVVATEASYPYLNSRASSYDATLSLQDAPAFTISAISGLAGGPYVFPAKPKVTRFDDSHGYYPGFYTDTASVPSPCGAGSLCYWNRDGSAVIPALNDYGVAITDYNGDPLPAYYGLTLAPGLTLGSGNPGEDNAQYGVAIELLSKTFSGSSAKLRFSNTKFGGSSPPAANAGPVIRRPER